MSKLELLSEVEAISDPAALEAYIAQRARAIVRETQGEAWCDPEDWQAKAVELAHACVRRERLVTQQGITGAPLAVDRRPVGDPGPVRSRFACHACGEYHLLGAWSPGDLVRFAVIKRRRTNRNPDPRVAVGASGRVVEWSQVGGPIYYRVEFSGGVRENFDPCELASVVP